jgi:hypothetical protein
MNMFEVSDKAKTVIKIVRGLNLAVVKLTTVKTQIRKECGSRACSDQNFED